MGGFFCRFWFNSFLELGPSGGMADTRDLKSLDPKGRAGSSPASGIPPFLKTDESSVCHYFKVKE